MTVNKLYLVCARVVQVQRVMAGIRLGFGLGFYQHLNIFPFHFSCIYCHTTIMLFLHSNNSS